MTSPSVPVLVEAAIDSTESAQRAVAEGADRLEVCANLDVGGLTPTVELLKKCLALDVPCVAMARPRAGGFSYGATQIAQLHEMIARLLEAGASGIVFGVLATDNTIDETAVRDIVRMCAGRDTVFHRAFDTTPYARRALETLMSCGVKRVLTSGQARTAAEGTKLLKAAVGQAAGKIEILAGGGVRSDNVRAIVDGTGVMQVHARGTEPGVIAELRAALSLGV